VMHDGSSERGRGEKQRIHALPWSRAQLGRNVIALHDVNERQCPHGSAYAAVDASPRRASHD
jgi:hypothetical protein